MRFPNFVKFVLISACCLAIPLTAWAGQNWRSRAATEQEITSGDVAAEIAYGREISARILSRYKPYDNAALLKYVNLVGLSLAQNANRPELDFHFMVLDTSEVNAYAAPGGYVFVTAGALKIMKSESELAGVLAHEIGHIVERHVVKEFHIIGTDDTAISGLAHFVGGGSEAGRAAFVQVIDKSLDFIYKNGYKREDEMQADKAGVILSAVSGYEASALAQYLNRTKAAKERVVDTDPTHPSFDSRIARIYDTISQEGIDANLQITNQQRFVEAMKYLTQ